MSPQNRWRDFSASISYLSNSRWSNLLESTSFWGVPFVLSGAQYDSGFLTYPRMFFSTSAPAKRHDETGGRTFSWIHLGCLGCCPTDPSITSFVPPPSGSAYFNVAGISCWIHFWNCYDYKELNQDTKLTDCCHQFRIHTSSVYNIWLAVSSCFFWFTNSQWGSWTCKTSHLPSHWTNPGKLKAGMHKDGGLVQMNFLWKIRWLLLSMLIFQGV